ncbi:MAG TPA: hypothetical protein VGO32_03495 [Candidatus Limnocylindria bacterium]|jgi:hypothetical protein|nr:hypothetical protein [Candidatus Limnocylindria bacterium]
MTMMSPPHPDPERLAALASQDADVVADRALTDHVASCAECTLQVREISALRATLAELPDLTPSRPMQLVPPVAAPPVAAGWRTVFRRAFAPVAVAGMVLLLVGGIGATGVLGPADAQRLVFLPFQAATGGSPAERPVTEEAAPGVTATDGGVVAPAASAPADNAGSGGGEDDPGTSRGEGEPGSPAAEDLDSSGGSVTGWVILAMAGLALLVLAFFLRIAAPTRSAAKR